MRLVGRSATDLADLVRRREVSARSVVEAHLDQIDRYDERLGAFQIRNDRVAITAAQELDDRDSLEDLPLAGVPVAIKDVVDVLGLPTRHGSTASSPVPADSHDELVARLVDAGAVVVGKTRGPELSLWATSGNVFGHARNPWDIGRVPGGSSGGSAAAVASGMVPIALGSDGLGSIRIPSASCGVVGLKPGSGVVPIRFGEQDRHWFGMSQFGPMATTVADVGLMLDVLAGTDTYRTASPPTGLRVAVSVAGPAQLPVSREFVEATLAAARCLRGLGHTVERADPPYSPAMTLAIAKRWMQGAAEDVEILDLDVRSLERRSRAHVRAGRLIEKFAPVDDREAARWQSKIADFFSDYDLLLTPMLGRTAIPAGEHHRRSWPWNLGAQIRYGQFASPWNLADVPAAAVPAGVAGDGLPVSVQLVAPHGHEARLLGVMDQLEQGEGWPRHAPEYV